jgi:hypothetical protein
MSGDTARIMHRPDCDVCSSIDGTVTPALYDGKTVHGPWAYMCEACFAVVGVGRGPLGQLLLVTDEEPNEEGRTG